jgi:hypothetical protein
VNDAGAQTLAMQRAATSLTLGLGSQSMFLLGLEIAIYIDTEVFTESLSFRTSVADAG